MENIVRGKAWVGRDNLVAFDIIQNDRKTEFGKDAEQLGKYALETVDPEFAEKARAGEYKIIVSGINFGGGAKSIEHPVYAVMGAGIKVVIGESISRYFFRNAINNGFPVLTCTGITEIVQTGDELEVNLSTGEIKNLTNGKTITASAIDEQAQAILDAGGYVNYTKQRLEQMKK